MPFKLSVSVTGHAYVLGIGLLNPGAQPGQTSGESVDGMSDMDSSDWSKGIRYHVSILDRTLSLTLETRVPNALDDVASNICLAIGGGG
jgi:hypothetical protein